MRCRKAEKLMLDFVAGDLAARREARVRSHIAGCGSCADVWARERLVEESLEGWRDLPVPADALASIEARIAFAPPPAAVPRPGRIRSLFVPYAAGLATAAAVLLLAGVEFGPGTSRPEAPADAASPVADAEPELLPDERPLQFVDGSGSLREVPWDEATERYLRRTMDWDDYQQLRFRATNRSVDYEAK